MIEVPFPAYAALVSSLLWAAASVYTFQTVKEIGPVLFNVLRVSVGFVTLWIIIVVSGQWSHFDLSAVLIIMLSGAIGVFLGDILRYMTLIRLGPRRTVVFMAMSSPLVIVFGAVLLNEVLSLRAYAGIALVLLAVVIMGLFDVRSNGNKNRYELIKGVVSAGIAIGLLAAVFQAGGIILAKIALNETFNPLQATALRITGAFLSAVIFTIATGRIGSLYQLTPKQFSDVVVSTLMAMVGGTIILIYALKNAPASIVTVFQSMVPVFVTIIVWLVMRQRPHFAALASVIVIVSGVVLIAWP